MKTDVVVVGGGPVGLVAAIAAAIGGMRVLVMEPREGTIDKACGEGIMPSGVRSLARLGVEAVGLPFVGIRYLDALDASCSAVGTFPHGSGLGCRRLALHEALRERAHTVGVRFRDARVRAFERSAEGVSVEGVYARWLVGADGLGSTIRALVHAGDDEPERSGTTRLGLRRHVHVAPWSDRVEVSFADGVEAYVTPVAEDVVGVAFLFERTHAGSWESLLQRFPDLARRLASSRPASRVRGAGPFVRRTSRRVVGPVLLVGDAAGYLDPLTGEGLALGFATAEAAIESLLSGEPTAYEARYRRLSRRHFQATSLLLAITRRRRLHRPLIRLASALPFAFDQTLGLLSSGLVDERASRPRGWSSDDPTPRFSS